MVPIEWNPMGDLEARLKAQSTWSRAVIFDQSGVKASTVSDVDAAELACASVERHCSLPNNAICERAQLRFRARSSLACIEPFVSQ